MKDLLLPFVILLVPSFLLFYFATEIYLRNKKHALHRLIALFLHFMAFAMVGEFSRALAPIEYSGAIFSYWTSVAILAALGLGQLFGLKITKFEDKIEQKWVWSAICFFPLALYLFLALDNRLDWVFTGFRQVGYWKKIVANDGYAFFNAVSVVFLLFASGITLWAIRRAATRGEKRIFIALLGGNTMLFVWNAISFFMDAYNWRGSAYVPPLPHLQGAVAWAFLIRWLMSRFNFMPYRFATLFQLSPIPTLLLDKRMTIVEANLAAGRLFGYAAQRLKGLSLKQFVLPERISEFEKSYIDSFKSRQKFSNAEKTLTNRSGVRKKARMDSDFIDIDGEWLKLLMIRDVTKFERIQEEKQQALLALQNSEERYRRFFEQIPLMVHISNGQGILKNANQYWLDNLGYEREEVFGRSIFDLLSGESRERALQQFWPELLDAGHVAEQKFNWLRKDGSVFYGLTKGRVVYNRKGEARIYMTLKDYSFQQNYEEQLAHLAYHDSLTGLPNRELLNMRLNQEINQAKKNGGGLAVILIDLDRFKLINDSLGHQAGDQLLQHVSSFLWSRIHGTDTVARLGGDEFVILLPDISSSDEVEELAQNLLEIFRRPFVLDGQEVFITSSIGISRYPEDGDTVAQLLKCADMAMYAAKEQGRNKFQIYDENMHRHATHRLSLETNLRKALENGELLLFYQPQIEFQTGLVTGMEALIRWHSPENGWVGPGEFIPVSEDNGLIVPIGYWVLEEGCRQAQDWSKRLNADLKLSVNVSVRQLLQPDFVENVKRIIKEAGFEPSRLCLEVTESTAIQNIDITLNVLNALSEFGISISLDDFGTGYSSLSSLKRLPIDIIKIDQSFVRDMTNDQDDAAIVSAIIAMSRSLQIKVVAEGVENEKQYSILKNQGCNGFQGFYKSPPIPADQFEHKFLSR